ncbi:MAG: DUF4199 domain-containing protein [Arcicella sp.]|nr:DUF4199 domain-containing protein [Arcicella sp.]
MFNKSLLKNILLFGFVSGTLTLLYCLILKLSGQIPLDGKKAPSIILSVFCMIFAVKAYRKNNPGRKKPRAFLGGGGGRGQQCLTNFVGSCVSALGLYVWLSSDGNTILADYIAQTIKTLNVSNVKMEYVKEMGIESFNSIIAGFKILSPKNISRRTEIRGLGCKRENTFGGFGFRNDFIVLQTTVSLEGKQFI